jgi:NADPH:quinone reductase
VFHRSFGAAFGIGGWLLMNCLQKIGFAAEQRLRARVVAELKTTFASHYTKAISLAEALHLEEITSYSRRATGGKYLINPNKGIAT